MFNHQNKQITRAGYLSSCIACVCASCILLILLVPEGVEARLVWIPRNKDGNEGSAEHHNVINSENDKMVSAVILGYQNISICLIPLSVVYS